VRLVDRGRRLDANSGGDEACHAHVGGHLVSDPELDDVVRDEVLHREDREPGSIAEHHVVVGLGVERLLGVGLLLDADDGVDDANEEDDERLDEGGECELVDRGGEHEEEGDVHGGQEDGRPKVTR
jgi:hypothetical protein